MCAFIVISCFGCGVSDVPTDEIGSSSALTQNSSGRIRTLDHEMLDTVLNDLQTYSGEDSPFLEGEPFSTKNDLLFDVESATYQQTVNDVLLKQSKETWENLSSIQIESAKQAAEDLVGRIDSEVWVENYTPDDDRVRLVEHINGSRRPISAWPPGYSANKRFAIVRLIIPWSMHHIESTHILENNGDEWAVVLRQFVYYL